jgi:ribosomal protein S28E/S33
VGPVANVNDAPVGLPIIQGTLIEDQVLSVDTSGITDADGLGSMGLQWLRNGSAIAAATTSTYTLTQADVGAQISVRVAWTDGQGTGEVVTSAQAGPVLNLNDPPTGAPVIVGTMTEDQTLTLDTSSIADGDGLGGFAVQWLRNGSAIAGATSASYVLSDADVGSSISAEVRWTDAQGTAEMLTSTAGAAVLGINDAPVGLPTISGAPVENQTLTAQTGGLSDADGLGAFSYQWLRNGLALGGATAATYTAGDLDVGALISVRVSYTDNQGTTETVTSGAVGSVLNVNDAPSGLPTVGGTPAEDQILTASTGALADIDGLGSFSYQWLRDGVAIGGATASSYLLGDADVGASIQVQVGWTDGQGTAELVSSAAVGPVLNVNDAPAGAPAIVGTAEEDRTLTLDTSSVADSDGLGSFSIQWLRNGSAVSGATGSTYALGDADVGSLISVRVNWIDAHGTAETLTSATLGPVANVNDAPTGAPSISGTPAEDQTLLAVTGSLGDADGLGSFSVQWLRNGAAVAGANTSTYVLGDADVGAVMQVRVSWTDGFGTSEVLTSAALSPVQPVNDVPAGAPVVLGTPTEDQTLTVDTSSLADADGLGAFSIQWLRNGSVVGGAVAASYTLGDADVGATISARVSWTDGQGTAEMLTSAALGPVANVNDPLEGALWISGLAQEDQTLTAETGALDDADGLGALSVQWLRNGAAIAGATASQYTLGDADVGAMIQVRVQTVDAHGTAESVTSGALGPVQAVNDAPTGQPVIQGQATEDQTLTADLSSIGDADGLGSMQFQWLRNGGAISGATNASYVLGDADVGALVQLQVRYTDGQGAEETLTSAPTAAVAGINDAPSGALQLLGTAAEHQTLTVDTGQIADADGLGPFTYRWLRDGQVIAGAETASYTLTEGDGGTQVTARVSWTDAAGSAEQLDVSTAGRVVEVPSAPVVETVVLQPIAEDSGPRVISQAELLAGARDADGDALVAGQLSIVRGQGSLTANTDGSWTYTPAADDDSSVLFSFEVSDGTSIARAEASLDITPVNDAPTLLPNSSSGDFSWAVQENQDGAIRLVAADRDGAGQALTFALSGGDDLSQFTVDGQNGELRFVRLPDYELPGDHNGDGVYRVEIQVEDASGARTRQVIEVRVQDVNDRPELTLPETVELDAAPESGAVVATASASDQDTGDQLHYRLTDDANGLFVIEQTTGQIRITDAQALRSAVAETYVLTVEVTDAQGSTQRRILSIRVAPSTPAPDAPAMLQPQRLPPGGAPVVDVSSSQAAMRDIIRRVQAASQQSTAVFPSDGAGEPASPASAVGHTWSTLLGEWDAARDSALRSLSAPNRESEPEEASKARVEAPAGETVRASDAQRADALAASETSEKLLLTLAELGGRVWSSGWRSAAHASDDSAIEPHDPRAAEPEGADALVLRLTDPIALTGMGVSLSLVWWLTRVGGLLATSAMVAPAWRQMDLLALVNDRQRVPVRPGERAAAAQAAAPSDAADVLNHDLGRLLPPEPVA